MGVRIVIGRAGSGKSLGCFRAIVEMIRADPVGETIYWIVPKQETFTAERELTCASGLNGFCRARIVSFDLLGEEILAECGGTAIPQINELGRQMVIGHLLRRHEKELKFYASAARQVGLAAELDATFAELERSGRSVEEIKSLITELESTPSGAEVTSLIAKLRDLRLLYEQYTAYLGQDRLDPNRRLAQVLDSVEGCTRVQQSTIFVDGFLEFTDHERRMLAGLAKVCREMQVTLLLDPASRVLSNVHENLHEMSAFYRTEDTFRRLWFAFTEAGITPTVQPLEKITRFENAWLGRIEQHFFAPRIPTCESSDGIELIEAPDRRGEVDAAARQIRKYIASGLRLRDIAVLMRSLDEYHELIDASFAEHGIPYFVDRRRTAGHHPLLQFTRSLLQIALHNWPHDAVMTLLKTDLTGLTRDQVDELENYVIDHRIHGAAWSGDKAWAFRRKLTRAEDEFSEKRVAVESIDANRRSVVDRVQPLVALVATQETIELRKIVLALFDVFERFKIRDALRQWIKDAAKANRLEERGEHEQVWSELIELLDQLVDILGDERVTAGDFVDILDTGLDRFDLALTPPTVDQVLVGTVDRTRSSRPKAVILLGMNDNQFPRVPREGSILSDGERQTLVQHRVELDPDSKRALLDERLLGYIAFTRASQFLCLTRSIADDEARPQAASVFWRRLREQFPTLQLRQIPRESGSLIDCVGTPRQLVTALMNWVRHGEISKRDSEWASLYHWLATCDCDNRPIDVMRYRAWRALSYTNEAKLHRDTASKLFQSPLQSSVSQIESFAACPFKHFLRYGLKLTQREDDDVTSLDLGNVCHGILENLVRQMLQTKAGWEEQLPTETIKAVAAQIGQELRGELMLSTARNQYILGHIEKTIEQVLAAQSAAGRRGKLSPWRAELEFGEGTKLGPLVIQLPGGEELRLQGKIDRVDFLADQSAFAVIDYKYRGSKLSLDRVYHGLSLQLLTYLLVLERNGSQLAKRKLTPVAAFYVQLLRELEKIAHPDDSPGPDDPKFHLRVKPRGLIDGAHRDLVDTELVTKASDVVSLYIKSDGSLGNKHATDGCESVEFSALLRLVERRLGELAQRIIGGEISVAPYRIAQVTPCPNCEYRSVCRFDVAVNRYNSLNAMKREDVLTRALEEAGGDGA